MGARANALGNASSCLSDVWSLSNNIAGLAKTDRIAAGFSYHAVPTFSSFNRMAAVFGVPIKTGVLGMSAFRFGDDLYNEQIISTGFANTFGLASLGIKINLIQYRGEGLPIRKALTASFGGIATLTKRLFFGAHVHNINQPVINELTGERIPTRLVAGIALKPSDNLFLSAEVDKDLEYVPVFKSGLEYLVLKKIAFRTGFNFDPEAGFFGVGFKATKFELSYALQLSEPYGISHQATVTWQSGKK